MIKHDDNLFKIGEVASSCDTTIKTIRYYEATGLVLPTKVDSETGYRYYDKYALKLIQKIEKLKKHI